MTPKKRRQYKTGSVFQAHSAAAGCPPLNKDGTRPKHRCKGRWVATFEAGSTRTGGRRRKTVTGKTEAEVKDKLDARQRALNRGEDISNRTTVKTWVATWLEMTERTVRPNTHTSDRSATAWIVETIGHRRIEQLTPADVRSVSTAITKAGLSTSTAHRYHGTLARILKAANEEGLPVPPRVLTVAGPTAAVNDRQALPTDAALGVLKAATDLPHASRWVAAFLQGIRQGEALGLLWENVRDDHYIVSWQLQPLPYKTPRDRTSGFRVPDGYEATQLVGQLHLVRPKSKAGWRVIPLLPVMANALAAWQAVSPESPHGLVWPAANGNPAGEVDDREEFYALQEAARVGHPAGRYYKLHEARNTTATLLLEMGVPESVRIAIMGHSTIASTKAYEYVDTAEMRRALEKVAGVLKLG